MTVRELMEKLAQINPEAVVTRGDSEYGCVDIDVVILADEDYRASYLHLSDPGTKPLPDAAIVLD